MKLPRGPFSCVVADPPWLYRTFSTKGQNRGAQRHYPLMTLDAIKAMPVARSCAPDAHLFLWATGPMIREAFEVMEAWGFRYSSLGFVWVKTLKSYETRQVRFLPMVGSELHFGTGHTTRQNAELVLLGRRGKPKRLSRAIQQVILAPRREHSRKPDEAFARIEQYCAGPRLELFARAPREGWTVWGNEVDKFKPARG